MKISVIGIIVLLLAATAFGQNQRQVVEGLQSQIGDLRMENNRLKQDNQNLTRDLEAARRAAQTTSPAELELERNRAQRATGRADSLQRRVDELSPKAAQGEVCAENLRTLLAQQSAAPATPAPVVAAPVAVFRYPVGGMLTGMNRQMVNNADVLVSDFSFTNLGSRTITAFDATIKFYFQERLIFEMPFANVRQAGAGGANVAIPRGGNFAFRAGIPVSPQSQQLIGLRPEQIDLVIEITRAQ